MATPKRNAAAKTSKTTPSPMKPAAGKSRQQSSTSGSKTGSRKSSSR